MVHGENRVFLELGVLRKNPYMGIYLWAWIVEYDLNRRDFLRSPVFMPDIEDFRTEGNQTHSKE